MDKVTTAERLNEIMRLYGLRQVDILKLVEPRCKETGIKINKSDLSQFVSGKVVPGSWKLNILAKALNISEAWLMGYDVPMRREADNESADEITPPESELLANYRQLSDESRSTVSGLATLLVKLERRQAAPPYTSANVHPGVTLPPVDQIADLKNAAFATDKTDTELNEDMTADD